jgi:hypothetical protein
MCLLVDAKKVGTEVIIAQIGKAGKSACHGATPDHTAVLMERLACRAIVAFTNQEEQMRLQGIESFEQVAKAFVQSNGEISIIPRENETNSSKREGRRQV